MSLLSVDEARLLILEKLKPLEAETLPLEKSAHRVLATAITANHDLPAFDNSSMDGFAVIADDLSGATPSTPRTLSVIADIPAGIQPTITIRAGQSARIMTGAALPPGADAVIPVEETDFKNRDLGANAPDSVTVMQSVKPGDSVRKRGMDARKGQIVLPAGHGLRAQDLGLLAMLGVSRLKVYRQARIALLSSGDELIPIESPLQPGKVRDANTYTLSALLEDAGADVIRLGIAADRRDSVMELLDTACENSADLILSSAGVSVGAFDFIKSVLEEQGILEFWRVNMRPGKPLTFGNYKGIPFIGLPGNPVSAFVGFEVFVRPAIERLNGMPYRARLRVRVRLSEQIESDGRESYLRAEVQEHDGVLSARLAGHQGSGNLLSIVQGNALLIIPAGVKSLAAGKETDAWLL